MLGIAIIAPEIIGVILGFAVAAAYCVYPYFSNNGREAGWPELLLGVVAALCWWWMALHYSDWIIDLSNRPLSKWLPGAVAIVLTVEAVRRSSGFAIAALVWLLILYFLTGHWFPGVLETDYTPLSKAVMHVYADSNSVTGIVLTVIISLVVAFMILGKVMDVGGATKFFTDLAMSWMGHRRGGPAKVAVLASSFFGTISGSTVGNIMSTGIVTIPLMKRTGFKARHAAAIEAVASNGGQIAPPIMGATAFLIAEFAEVSYVEVALAAAIPALIYYLSLFSQVDALAASNDLEGLPRSDLPEAWAVLTSGWIFLLPLALLIYLIFWHGYNAGLSALYAVAALLIVITLRQRRLISIAQWREIIIGAGQTLLPLILIGAAAGIVIGVMNFTGLGFQLTLILKTVGTTYGLAAMLALTAMIAIVLGMGMPTAAVYIVLSIVLVPAIINMNVETLPAHMFVFYFGLLSMLTPPVAVASYVAAGLAQANMWQTGLSGLRLAGVAYVLPFAWVYNPALLGYGSWVQIAAVTMLAIVLVLLQARLQGTWSKTSTRSRLLQVATLIVLLTMLFTASDYPAVMLAGATVGFVIWFVYGRNDPTFTACRA